MKRKDEKRRFRESVLVISHVHVWTNDTPICIWFLNKFYVNVSKIQENYNYKIILFSKFLKMQSIMKVKIYTSFF